MRLYANRGADYNKESNCFYRGLPGLCLVKALICDGHDLLEDVANVLWLALVLVLTRYVQVGHIGPRDPAQSKGTRHHVGLIVHPRVHGAADTRLCL